MNTKSRLLLVIIMSFFCLPSWTQVKIKVKPIGASSSIALWEYNIEKAKAGRFLSKEGSMFKFDDAILTGTVQDFGVIEYKNKTYLVSLSDITSNAPEFQSYINESKKELERIQAEKVQELREELKRVMFSTIQLMNKNTQLIDGNVYVKTKTTVLAKSIFNDNSIIINSGDSVYLACYVNDTIYFEKDAISYFAFARDFDSEITNEIQSKADIAYNKMVENQKKIVGEQSQKEALFRARNEEKNKEKQEYLYKNHVEKYGARCAEAIKNKKVYIGMSAEAARLSWGKPTEINTTATIYGSTEQWVYGLKSYLYVEKDKVSAIQN